MILPRPKFHEWAKAPRSVWQSGIVERQSRLVRTTAPTDLPASIPYAIVGAGMTGLATALELVRAGVSQDDIVVLDAVGPAFGATGRNAGFVLSFPGTEILDWEAAFGAGGVAELCRLNRLNRDTILDFVDEWNAGHAEEPILLQRGGSVYLAESVDEARDLDRSMELVSAGAEDQFTLGPPEGPIATNHYRRALIGKRDAGINPCEYACALAASAGVRLVTGDEATVIDMRIEHGQVRLAMLGGAELRAGNVLLATNGYARALLGARWPVMPVRNQVMVARCHGFDAKAEWGEAVYYANHGYDYWRVLPDGRIVLGGGRNRVPGREEGIMEFGDQPESRGYLRDVLLDRLTDGDAVTIEQQWSGIMGYSPDGVPFLGTVPATEDRVWFAGGFTGYGLGFHRVVARAAAGCLLGQGTPGIFDASRLAK